MPGDVNSHRSAHSAGPHPARLSRGLLSLFSYTAHKCEKVQPLLQSGCQIARGNRGPLFDSFSHTAHKCEKVQPLLESGCHIACGNRGPLFDSSVLRSKMHAHLVNYRELVERQPGVHAEDNTFTTNCCHLALPQKAFRSVIFSFSATQ